MPVNQGPTLVVSQVPSQVTAGDTFSISVSASDEQGVETVTLTGPYSETLGSSTCGGAQNDFYLDEPYPTSINLNPSCTVGANLLPGEYRIYVYAMDGVARRSQSPYYSIQVVSP